MRKFPLQSRRIGHRQEPGARLSPSFPGHQFLTNTPGYRGGMNDPGYVVVERLLSANDVALVLERCNELLALPSNERHPRDKVANGTRHLEALDTRSDAVAAVAQRPALLAHVEALLGPSFGTQVVSFRSPQPTFGRQQLHTDDLPKLDHGPDRVATAIVALVDFTEDNGPTRVVPGSHRRPDLQKVAGNLESHPDEVQFIAPAGSVLLFSGHLLHSGTQNTSNADRPALQLTWRRI